MTALDLINIFKTISAPNSETGKIVNTSIMPCLTALIQKLGGAEQAVAFIYECLIEENRPNSALQKIAGALYLHNNNKVTLTQSDANDLDSQQNFIECYKTAANYCTGRVIILAPEPAPAPTLSHTIEEIFKNFRYLQLAECQCNDRWTRNVPDNFRNIIEDGIVQFAINKRLTEFTIVSVGAGQLLQDSYIAYKLAAAGIKVNYIIIDPKYLFNSRAYLIINQFKIFLAQLDGKAKFLGAFTSMDSYLAAYKGCAAPKYALSQEQPRTRYTVRYDHELTTKKQTRNTSWIHEVQEYTTKCLGKKPDLVIAIDPLFANDSGMTKKDDPLFAMQSSDELPKNVAQVMFNEDMFNIEHVSRLRREFGTECPEVKMYLASSTYGVEMDMHTAETQKKVFNFE